MTKDIIEIVVALLLCATTIIGAVKYWAAVRSFQQIEGTLQTLKYELKEATDLAARNLKECKMGHEGCARDVQSHLRNSDAHRDIKLEEFRWETLTRSLNDLKTDLFKNLAGIEKRIDGRMDTIEKFVTNTAKG